jgi:hypothetical protein
VNKILEEIESINKQSLIQANKGSNIGKDCSKAIKRLDELGIIINGSFILGLDVIVADIFLEYINLKLEYIIVSTYLVFYNILYKCC